MLLYLTPSRILNGGLPASHSNAPIWVSFQLRLAASLRLLPVQIAGLAGISFLAVHRRDKPESWLYAFLVGFALTLIVGRLLT
jgi:hypothetical protein